MKPVPALLFAILFIAIIAPLSGQNPAKHIRQGNKAFGDGQFQDAEILYRRALETDNKWEKQALFNIGNALYKQQRYEESGDIFRQLTANESITGNEKAQVYHNLGNSYLMQEKYRESIDAYKNALRINPHDEDTRYNLSYAFSKMQQQQQEQQQNQDNKDQQEKQNQQNQDNKQEQKEQQEQQNKNEQKDDRKDQQQKQQPQISRQDMERMLNAISGKDKQTLEELREKELKKGGYKPEKDW